MDLISKRLTDEEYKEKYIKSDYYQSTNFESRTYENWLNEQELQMFEDAAASDDIWYEHDTGMAPEAQRLLGQDPKDHTTAKYFVFDNFYDKPAWKPLVDIIQPKLESSFGNGVKASHIHVLESHFPYGLHNDAEQANMELAPKPAWTLIVPLGDYPSKTYVFNERSGNKDPWSWIHENNIQANQQHCVDTETYEKDFSPFTDYELLKYLTIESTFNWKRGSCFAADRFKYHCSDNYYNHGITSKKAIIMWTSME